MAYEIRVFNKKSNKQVGPVTKVEFLTEAGKKKLIKGFAKQGQRVEITELTVEEGIIYGDKH